jgi:hypothetical protein
MKSTDFAVARNDLQQCKAIETQVPDAATLPDEALLVKVVSFAWDRAGSTRGSTQPGPASPPCWINGSP